MKKFTKVSLIIAAVCAGLGIVFCGIGSVLGASFSNVKQMADEGDLDIGNWHFGEGIYYANNSGVEGAYDQNVTETVAIGKIKNLKLELDAADVIFEISDQTQEITVELGYGYQKYFSCETKEDTLHVKYDRKNKLSHSDAEITITVPKVMELENITIESGAGDVDFIGSGFSLKNLVISTGAGDLTAQELNVSELLDVEGGAGNIEIEQGAFGKVHVETGAGDCYLSGTVNGDIELETGAGDSDLELKGKESDFNYDLSTGVGEIIIGNTEYNGLSNSKEIKNEGAKKCISITSGVGEVEITFVE
ncbi:MAG: DUF4097 family beta strand repeat-containing protein [Roseburia sp.]